jgi:hypothetical protein
MRARLYEDVADLRQAVLQFTRRYNDEWLIERHGHGTPHEAYAAATASKAASWLGSEKCPRHRGWFNEVLEANRPAFYPAAALWDLRRARPFRLS